MLSWRCPPLRNGVPARLHLSGTDLAIASFAASLTDGAIGRFTSVKDVAGKNPIIRGRIDIPTDKGFQYKFLKRFNVGFKDISVPLFGDGFNIGDKTTAIGNMKQAKNVIINSRKVIAAIAGGALPVLKHGSISCIAVVLLLQKFRPALIT